MFFEVKHVTRFVYDGDVFLEPLLVRLRPRDDGAQRLHRYDLEIAPRPAGISEQMDLEGNVVTCAWFAGLTRELEITSTFLAETRRENPFDFLLRPGIVTVADGYTPEETDQLRPYLQPQQPAAEVEDFAEAIRVLAGGEIVPFLSILTERIHQRCQTIARPHGDAYPPAQTLAEGRGACRDLAVVFNEACRAVGIPARFVSGYSSNGREEDNDELHAWSEVYLPGAGWRGYDPSLGLTVADGHVAVAASRATEGASPTCGKYRGSGVTSTLHTHVEVHVGSDDPRWEAEPRQEVSGLSSN